MVEMGTFVAILVGNILGGLLISMPEVGAQYVAWGCLALACAGLVAAWQLPPTPASDPQLTINWNPVTETWRNLKLAHQGIAVFRSLLGISWMWFVGAVFLGNFPSFAKEVLHGDEQVATLLLVVFSVGIAIGSLLCEMLSRRMVEIGLVPLGALGMTVFAIDLYLACSALPAHAGAALGLAAFVQAPGHARVLVDLGLLALSAGLYSVPMYALIQLRAQPTHRARIIAANNILNALFMVAASVIAGLLLKSGFSIPELFGLLGLANALVGLYIFLLVPEYLLRFVAFVLSHTVYRLQAAGHGPHPHRGRGPADLQPRQLHRRHAADGRQPAPGALRDGPPHLRHAGAGLDVPAGQGHPHCAAKGRPGHLRAAFERRRAGAARGRDAGHLPRGRHHARRQPAGLQGRRR
jgi:hypothetical protein